LGGADLEAARTALAALVRDPAAAVRAAQGAHEAEDDEDDPSSERARLRRRALEDAARRALAARRTLLERRLKDTERALDAADDAARLRGEADLLLARAHDLPRGRTDVTIEGFDGASVDLRLDPALDVAANAGRRYEQARKREARAERALAQHDQVRSELDEVVAAEAGIEGASDDALRALGPDDKRAAVRRASRPGIRVVGPHGLEVVIGRSARENDLVTFRVGRSDDVWLHAQGYHGAHVLIRAQGKKEVPFDAVLFAAQLAAGHSEAGGSDNVAVDYTSRKHVWKVKGAPAGAVSYAQQKTVYVTPLRRSQVD
jgi:predicted ribosome quality control (RQC) complex YloA/Tae2 family protein